MTSAGDCALVLLLLVRAVLTQDYDVTDIQCTFSSGGTGLRDSVTALLRKPEGFRGAPLFADDRATDPVSDPLCQIRPEPEDPTGLLYRLRIADFTRCGVLKRNGFVHVRVWFPQFPGVVMQSDQELIIMCKPPEPTIIENKAAGFAGSFPHGARVSGVVEETPGRLEYEVALYKEAPPVSRHTNHSVDLPVDQAVPIGTKLQLRARINPESAWRHIKLLEVAVSPDPDRPHAPGAVLLVKEGCRNRDFASIIPHQPARYRERHNEVFLDFEAFLLASMKERSTLWIHSQIKACMDAADCQPDYCLDLFEPSGHGRRRRSLPDASHIHNITSAAMVADNGTTPFTRFKENLEYTVVMPGELFHRTPLEGTCATSMMVAAALGALLFMSALLGFVHVRVWFPQFPGVVMQSDQELIIMCKPPEPTIIENKAAGFAGSFPHGARVSGVVEETPGRLEYEVALYKEAPPVSRHTNHSVDLPVDQAVPIGTKLQLRARINPESAWRHIKLLEVAVSPDPDRPHAPGAVLLVKEGCRNRDFASIIPHQPARYRERHNEVFLDFEAFLLASMKERSTLWIHSQIKACMDAADCQPDYCLDLFEPSGHGRRRRSLPDASHIHNITSAAMVADNGTTPFTRFKENLEYTVVMPGELFHRTPLEGTCATSMMVAAALGALLFMSALLMCYLATRLNSTILKNNSLQAPSGKSFEQILRELAHHSLPDSGYTGRPTLQ